MTRKSHKPSIVKLKVTSTSSFLMDVGGLESETEAETETDEDEEYLSSDEGASGDAAASRNRSHRARRSGDDTKRASRGDRDRFASAVTVSQTSIRSQSKRDKEKAKPQVVHTKEDVKELQEAIVLLELELMQRSYFGNY